MSVIDSMEIQQLLTPHWAAWSNQWIKNAQVGGGEQWLFDCQGHDFQRKNGPPPSTFAGRNFIDMQEFHWYCWQDYPEMRYLKAANIRCSVPLACQLCRQYGAKDALGKHQLAAMEDGCAAMTSCIHSVVCWSWAKTWKSIVCSSSLTMLLERRFVKIPLIAGRV